MQLYKTLDGEMRQVLDSAVVTRDELVERVEKSESNLARAIANLELFDVVNGPGPETTPIEQPTVEAELVPTPPAQEVTEQPQPVAPVVDTPPAPVAEAPTPPPEMLIQ
jgi:hypothetical protein